MLNFLLFFLFFSLSSQATTITDKTQLGSIPSAETNLTLDLRYIWLFKNLIALKALATLPLFWIT